VTDVDGGRPPAWVGVEWAVVGYRVADALTAPLASSVPTIRFDADGTVRGTTGCNRYTGRYALDGNELAVSPLATTRMMCADAVMEQEMAYLGALPWVAAARVVDADLVLTDLDGAPVVVARVNG
jgi:heat shock protein HslJ